MKIATVIAGVIGSGVSWDVANAQIEAGSVTLPTNVGEIRARNKNTLGVIAGEYGKTHAGIVSDLAAVLDDGDALRILPMVGQGSLRNVSDLLYLRGVDLAIVQSDVLAHIKANPIHEDIDQQIAYVAKLFNEELHIVAGPGISSIGELSGKKVSLGSPGSGARITATAVFEAGGIDVIPTDDDFVAALDRIKSGEIAAAVLVGAKPVSAIASLRKGDGFQLLSIDYAGPLMERYLPANFSSDDYAGLLARGERVSSISVDSIMVMYNWQASSRDHYTRIKRFVDAFVRKHEELKHPARHPKWRELSLNVRVPGWNRHVLAELAIEKFNNSRAAFLDDPSSTAFDSTVNIKTAATGPAAVGETDR